MVQAENGAVYRRNRQHLLASKEAFEETISDSEDLDVPPQVTNEDNVQHQETCDHESERIDGPTDQPAPVPMLQPPTRVSSRPKKKKVKLTYDEHFHQAC